MELDRPRIGATAQYVTAAYKAERAVIEVINTEVVDDCSAGPGSHVGVQMNVLTHKHWDVALRLVSIISSDHALFSDRIVGPAYTGQQ